MNTLNRLVLALLCSYNFTCASSMPEFLHITDSYDFVRQCKFPVKYAISDSYDQNRTNAIDRAFRYWNDTLGWKAFRKWGVVEAEVDDLEMARLSLLMVGNYSHTKRKVCATAKYDFSNRGCIVRSQIRISQSCDDKLSTDQRETLIRHEIGHLLGLGHNEEIFSLMYKNPMKEGIQPVGLTRGERKIIDIIYKDRIF